ncbi:putative Chromosome-associated kinesin KIF4B [Blattamonas nauphoetae]|uniref:Kinesin-like protein n=1 Tax=Blattamonas nauphoetae TaxID=2049346 RepID=A0ABQ9XWZ9_9EUKA|nr:putative Chromosome-associated kinesin KIF4B [Blattamonas nauphoetae]
MAQPFEPIRVMVRIRPLAPHEFGSEICASQSSDTSVELIVPPANPAVADFQVHQFDFSRVFNDETSQTALFSECGLPALLDDVILRGYSASVLAYGQTGTGKTYTITGPEPKTLDEIEQHRCFGLPTDGLIPQSVSYLFDKIEQDEEHAYKVSVSYYEIYNEHIYDLLQFDTQQKKPLHKAAFNPYAGPKTSTAGGPKPLPLRSVGDAFYIEGLSTSHCNSREDLITLLENGQKNRHVASHNLNMESSRSHALLTLKVAATDIENGPGVLDETVSDKQELARRQSIRQTVTKGGRVLRQKQNNSSCVRRGKVTFVDLAGSERLKQSGSENENKRETMAINKSLFTLGAVINALSALSKKSSQNPATSLSTKHIPYRDSKLTALLKDSLGGTAKSMMIACITPSQLFSQISLSTLNYAQMVQSIKNKPVKRIGEGEAQFEKMREEIRQLKREIEYWREQAGDSTLKRGKERSMSDGARSGRRGSLGQIRGGPASSKGSREPYPTTPSVSPMISRGSTQSMRSQQLYTPTSKDSQRGVYQQYHPRSEPSSPYQRAFIPEANQVLVSQIVQAEMERQGGGMRDDRSSAHDISPRPTSETFGGSRRDSFGSYSSMMPTSASSQSSNSSIMSMPSAFTLPDDYLDEVNDAEVLRAIAHRLKVESNAAVSAAQHYKERLTHMETLNSQMMGSQQMSTSNSMNGMANSQSPINSPRTPKRTLPMIAPSSKAQAIFYQGQPQLDTSQSPSDGEPVTSKVIFSAKQRSTIPPLNSKPHSDTSPDHTSSLSTSLLSSPDALSPQTAQSPQEQPRPSFIPLSQSDMLSRLTLLGNKPSPSPSAASSSPLQSKPSSNFNPSFDTSPPVDTGEEGEPPLAQSTSSSHPPTPVIPPKPEKPITSPPPTNRPSPRSGEAADVLSFDMNAPKPKGKRKVRGPPAGLLDRLNQRTVKRPQEGD